MNDAIQTNRSERVWVFGYGSLIYKVDFPFLRKESAAIQDWERRFWQGSHDHRGTPEAPGRVVTLVPSAGSVCRGIAYLVENAVFEHLDHREKNGYLRQAVDIRLRHVEHGEQSVTGVVYLAEEDNHAYLGPASLTSVARQISCSKGPSGTNRDYLLQLADALRMLGEDDCHVFELEGLLLGQSADPAK